MLFNNDERYARQIRLPELGLEGQQRIQKGKVLLVGIGGLGSPISLYLTAAGIGTLGIMDADTVSLSNLQRQVLYTEGDLGKPKTSIAAQRLHALNSNVKINIYPFRLLPENAASIISNYDVVIDGCDNYSTRYLINDTCQALHIPYVYGSIYGFEGQVSVFCYAEHQCTYRDLYPDMQDNPEGTPPPVIGTTAAVTGSVQASEALKLITGCGEPLVGKLWNIDLLTMQSHIIEL